MWRSPLRNVNNMVLALLLLLAGVGPGGWRGVEAQLAAKPTRGPHPSSPCPSVFSYEGREPEKNRWYGVILVSTDETLDGLRLNVRLTHRAQILGNFIGDVSSPDNVDFTILNLKMRLTPGPPHPVRIFAAFGDRDDIPYIANIKLNGRTICGSGHPEQSADGDSRPTSTPAITRPADRRPGGNGGTGGFAGIAAGHQFDDEVPPPPRRQQSDEVPPPPRRQQSDEDIPPPPRRGGGSAGIAAGYQSDDEVPPPPRPSTSTPRTMAPPPRATTPPPRQTAPPPRNTAAPQRPSATSRPAPVYDPTPNANPDNYYAAGNSDNNVAFNQYESSSKRPARPVDEDVYRQPAVNYTASASTTEAERGIYRPGSATASSKYTTTTERPERPAHHSVKYSTSTERSYSSKYTPIIVEADAYRRTTAPPRQPPRPASNPDTRPPPREDAMPQPQPQPWPTSNYDEPQPQPQPQPQAAKHRATRSTCGTIAPPATPLIINGETSIPGKWPWHVALYKPHGRDWKYQCGGSLVSPTVVVTAAHCVTTSVGRPVGPESLLVFLGKHALRTTSEDGVQDKHVYFIHVHPGYNYTNYRNDIAVLILSSPATITSAVRPVCLWDRDRADLSNVEGKFGTVVGWGIETDGLLTEELHQALMPVVSPAICVYSYPSFFGVYTNNQTYCAGYSPDQPAAGTSVCNGDSGGGMFFKRDEDVPDDEAVWMLRGLVSLSVRTKQDRCDPSHFVVFTDVAKYTDWLENFLAP